MSGDSFFKGVQRRVTIGSPTKQCSNGKIVVPISMPLSGESFVGMPDWISAGFDAVRDNFTEVDPEVQQVADIVLVFNNDKPNGEMFAAPNAKVPGGELKNFFIRRTGSPDDPEIELAFKVAAPFARDFWQWLGEMAGKEVWMAFPASLSGNVAVKTPSEPLPFDKADEPADAAKEPRSPKPKQMAKVN